MVLVHVCITMINWMMKLQPWDWYIFLIEEEDHKLYEEEDNSMDEYDLQVGYSYNLIYRDDVYFRNQ